MLVKTSYYQDKFSSFLGGRIGRSKPCFCLDKFGTFFRYDIFEKSRQTWALPFWGIGGLGLLLGISSQQYLDFIAPAIAIPLAIKIQQFGWRLEAKRLLLKTFEEIEKRVNNETK